MKYFNFRSQQFFFYFAIILLVTGCGGGSTPPPEKAPYKIIDLGLGYAGDINENGDVAGVSDGNAYIYSGHSNGYFYSGERKSFIGTFGIGIVSPAGINLNGQVVATYRPTISSSDTSVAYYNGTSWVLLGKFGSEFAWPNDINDSGQIAASYKPSGSGMRAIIYTSGTVTVIPVPGKAVGESAYNDTVEINNNGQVSGRFKDTSNVDKAYISDGTTVTELGTIATNPGRYSYGMGLNAVGNSVGVSQTNSYQRRAFIYKDSTMFDLGTLSGNSHASDINDKNIVVGNYVDTNGDTRAFIHDGKVMKDLTTLLKDKLWILETAVKINNAGEIIGKGIINGEVHGYLLVPNIFF